LQQVVQNPDFKWLIVVAKFLPNYNEMEKIFAAGSKLMILVLQVFLVVKTCKH